MEKKNTNVKENKKTLKEWLSSHWPTKRRIIQLYAALLTNANLKGFRSGQIYQGNVKYVCAPGLNCYSCPAASAACPLGALQNALASTNTKLPYYVIGILMLYGLMFGRWICGFLCPFGLIQDLLHKIKTPKLKKNRFTRIASHFKYVLLVVMVVILPLIYSLRDFPLPAFCKYICPSGTLLGAGGLLSNEANTGLFGMLGPLFTWKFLLLVIFIVGAIFIYRFFCRFFCPLGAIYGLFNKISFLGMKLDKPKCVDCGLCVGQCEMDIRHVGDHECISCGKCVNVCPTGAISYKGPKILLAPNEVGGHPKTKQEAVDPCDYPGGPLPKKTKIARLIVGLSMLALLVGALVYYNVIHKEPEPVTPPSSTVEDPSGREVGGEIGNVCPDYELAQYEQDGTIKASDTRGKVTVINFWYIYCSACVKELQTEFPLICQEYGDEVELIVVHSNQEYGVDILEYIQENFPEDLDAAHCRDVENEAFFKSIGGTSAWPVTVILDEEGVIQYKVIGSTNYEEMKAVIDGLLEG